uniref:Vacuolar protein sorting-associated protein 33A (Trinotate prediction) n=1 Tax=Henneguya salminicola TaxID=69463 RepID=A0A6G3ME17_HENSL
MENSDLYMNFLLDEDISVIKEIVNCLVTLQSMFGFFPLIKGKGTIAKKVVDILLQKNKSQESSRNLGESQISTLIIIDRSCDLMTPLLTELTYEGLLRSTFDISACKLTLPSSEDQDKKQENRSLLLNSSSEFYASLRYLMFHEAIKNIRQSATKFKEEFDQFMKTKNVTDLKKAVSNYPVLKQKKHDIHLNMEIAEKVAARVHTNIFETIVFTEQEFYLENFVDKPHPIIDQLVGSLYSIKDVVRLMCIQSIVRGGLSQKVYEYYCNALTQGYGYLTLNLILNLEKLGLMKFQWDSNKNRNFIELSKNFKLTNPKTAVANIFSISEFKFLSLLHSLIMQINQIFYA